MEKNRSFSGLEAKFYELSCQIVEGEGLKVYDMSYVSGSSTLRLFIINPQTNTAQLDECVRVDRAFSPHTETLEWMPESLILEVSSPGVFRELACEEHFAKVVGERIKLSLLKPLEAKNEAELPKSVRGAKKLIGVLKQLNGDSLQVDVDGAVVSLTFAQIKKANLEPEI